MYDLSRCRSFFFFFGLQYYGMGTYCRCHLHIHNNNSTRLLMAMSATIHAHISNPDSFVFMHFNVEFFFIRSMLPLLLLLSSIVFHKLKSKNHLLLLHYSFLQLKWVCMCVFLQFFSFCRKMYRHFYFSFFFFHFCYCLILFNDFEHTFNLNKRLSSVGNGTI